MNVNVERHKAYFLYMGFSTQVNVMIDDSDFIRTIDNQVRKFKSAIMRDYWEYRHIPKERRGFPGIIQVSDLFLQQKYFDERLEDYTRRYLINGFLGHILEARGNSIIFPSLPNELNSSHRHFTNKEYEEMAQYEFIAEFLNSNKLSAVRYTALSNDSKFSIDNIDEVIIIQWDFLGHIHGKDKMIIGDHKGKPVILYCLRSFMLEHGFTIEEYEKYYLSLSMAVGEVGDLLGAHTVKRLSAASMFESRILVESKLKKYVNDLKQYRKKEIQLNGQSYAPRDFEWAYHVIEKDNRMKYSDLQARSKSLLFDSGAVKRFMKNQYYLALIGKNSYSKSLATAENLYEQYNSDDCIDYTAIIAGYLKSVEQLLFGIVKFSYNKKCKIKEKSSQRKIVFSESNIDKCDISLGSLIYFLIENKGVLKINGSQKDCLFRCLMTYVNECRNDSFHKHNIREWCRVEHIRNNTFFLYIVLLGCCRLGNDEDDTDKGLGIVRNDKLERMIYWIMNIPVKSFYIRFWNSSAMKVTIRNRSSIPEFDSYGFITNYVYFLDREDSIDQVTGQNDLAIIKRDYLPEEMWYFDEKYRKISYKE